MNRAAARSDLVHKMSERVKKPAPIYREPSLETPEVGPDYDAISREQVDGAVAMLNEDTSSLPQYPLRSIVNAVGPLRGGDVHVLGGMQGNGKTAFCINVLDGLAAQEVPLLYAGLEVQRPTADLVHFANGYTMSPERVVGLAAHAAKERGVKVVILDHLQHLEYTTPHLRQAVGDAIKAIKACALEHEIAFVVASQLARRPGDKLQAFRAPAAAELKESSTIEQIADVVLFTHRGLQPDSLAAQKKFVEEGGDSSGFAQQNRLYLHVAKHRFGQRTHYSVPLHINAPCDRIDDDFAWEELNREDRGLSRCDNDAYEQVEREAIEEEASV